jgi:hypothetical protein
LREKLNIFKNERTITVVKVQASEVNPNTIHPIPPMKPTLFLLSLIFSNILFSQELSEFDLAPYNDELKFSVVEENEVFNTIKTRCTGN